MVTNVSCNREEVYQIGNASSGLSTYSLVYTVIAYTSFVGGYALWYRYRKLPYLASRDVEVLSISTVGVVVANFAGMANRYFGTSVPCELFVFCYLYSFPGAVWPLMVRLIMWVNRVKFNFAIAEQVATSSIQQVNVRAEELRSKRLLASLKFGLFLVFIVLVPYFIATVVVASSTCSLLGPSYYLFLPVAGLTLAVSFALFIYYRDVPDTFLLWRETAFMYFMFTVLAGPGFILSISDVGGFSSENPRVFDWGILVDLGYFAAFVVAVPLQIYFAVIGSNCWKRPGKADNPVDGLKELLGSKSGTEFFSMYLATTLSLESMLFYLAVNDWRAEYDTDLELAQTTGIILYNTYIKRDSQLEVNLGMKRKGYLADVFERKTVELTKDTFNDAATEVFRLMADNHFRNFERSDFHKLYSGELQTTKMTWIKATGVSSFHALDASTVRMSFI